MAAVGQMAGGIRRFFRWGEAQCGVRGDAGQDWIGQICGFFLSGINEDRLSEAYRNYSPGRDFLEIPIWLSSGQSDNVAKPQDHNRVKASLERTGFKHVRLERFSGGHQVKKEEVERALRWFREVAKF
jgi:hypothetical protein